MDAANDASQTSAFLSAEDIAILTGRRHKAPQIEALRAMGVAFWINAQGRPVVARAVVEGRKAPEAPRARWQPKILGAR